MFIARWTVHAWQREDAADRTMTTASATDSANAVTMRGAKPSARSVPISRVRWATAAYRVHRSGHRADRIAVTNVANTRISVPVVSDCPS